VAETRDTDIGAADVVRAWIRLGARTGEERALIARLLGFEYRFTGRERRPRTKKADPAAAVAPGASGSEGQTESVEAIAESGPSITLPILRVAAQNAPSRTTPDWLRLDRPLEDERPQHLDVRPPHEPLLHAGWTRAILSAACATSLADGPVDLPRLVEAIARCRPVTELPRETLPSLARGIELLIDRGENLMPFVRDLRVLQQELVSVVGRDRTRIRYFDGCPTLGCGTGPRSSWKRRFEPPPSDTPIVVLTDLGMARASAARTAATERTWMQFFQTARSAGCSVIVFAPYPLSRWPPALSRVVRAIPWDRPTTVSTVRQAVLRGHAG
jgi:hypothetical protein